MTVDISGTSCTQLHHTHGSDFGEISGDLEKLMNMMDKYGIEQTAGAGHNEFLNACCEELKDKIRESDLPDFMKDAAIEMIDTKLSELTKPVSSDCGCQMSESSTGQEASTGGTEAAGEAAGSSGGMDSHDIMSQGIQSEENEKNKEGGGSSGKGGSGNWLEALAGGLASAQIKFLDKMMTHQATMSGLAGKEDQASRDKFIMAQSKYQAAAQMFSMMANMTATSLKTLGEGLNSIARKQ